MTFKWQDLDMLFFHAKQTYTEKLIVYNKNVQQVMKEFHMVV